MAAPTTEVPTTDESPTTRELLAEIGSREPGHHHERPVEAARGERRFVRWLLVV
ncbi:MAG: hypothetical protein H7287_06725, partial [Thermoleophilia bacterium]|nr:hypothetical protein [Thermoleophilia bacterium]